ncbi:MULTISPECIES: Killer protein [Paraburkholderia]|uniref:Killer protein n=1 Tax=Paraburkholderia TaxID=1822464 RepID=UPI0004169533|nr:Killer protein [Paraburkholderia mimosarum]
MKRRSIAAALCITALACALVPPPAHADDNQNACGAVLCLAGLMMGGNGGKTCAEYESGYFSIVRFHHGHFDEGGTANARGDFLNQCQSVGSAVKDPVNSQYGRTQYGP